MSRLRSRMAVAVVALGATVVAAPAAPASAATVTACVRSDGAFTILLGAKAKKACPKGAKKVRWNGPGRKGSAGRPGSPGAVGGPGATGRRQAVLDRSGTVLGTFMGIVLEGVAVFIVQRDDGGVYYYYGSGALLPLLSPSFTTADCSGTGYIKPSGPPFTKATLLANVDGPARFVYRPTTSGFGAARAWKLTSTAPALVATQLYQLNGAGACVVNGVPYTGDLVALQEIPAPPDGVGPLNVG